MSEAIPPLPQYAFMAWYLVTHRDNFTLPNLTSPHKSQNSLTYLTTDVIYL